MKSETGRAFLKRSLQPPFVREERSMKGKLDLVSGWLRKARSDLLAMRASAQAGSLDAACFHAQQAAEKHLKAYLVEQDRDIPHTHNLYKLIALCREVDPSFS